MPLLFNLALISFYFFGQALLISHFRGKTHHLFKKKKKKKSLCLKVSLQKSEEQHSRVQPEKKGRERTECTWKPGPLLHVQNLKLAPAWWGRRGQRHDNRLTTCLEIRDSHWEIRETWRPGKRLLICSSAASSSSCQNCPSLRPLGGRLMHDESAVCSERFSHVELNSNPPFHPGSKNTPRCW